MSTIIFKNETNFNIKLHFYGAYEDICIEPKKAFQLALNQNSITFLVKEDVWENSFLKKTAGIVLASAISIFLWFLSCFEKEPMEDQIKFPTKFYIGNLSDDAETEITILESTKKFEECKAIVNGSLLESNYEFSIEEFDRQVKDYKLSKYLTMIFPFLILCGLWIFALFTKNILAVFLSVFVSFIIIYFYFKNEKRDKKEIERLLSGHQKNEMIVKLSSDDIMRILVTHFQEGDFGESFGHGELLGTPGEDLRFIGYFRTDVENAPFDYDINEIDKNYDFTGD